MEPATHDVIVIGAGLAGIAAARTAAGRGASVLVLDGQRPGGRARTDDHHGYRFNRGPHALYLGGHAQRVLTDLAVAIPGGPPSSTVSGSWAGGVAPLPAGPRTLLTTKLLGWRGRLAVGSLLSRLGKVDAGALASVSVRQWLDTLRLPADAEALLLTLIRVASYGNAPDVMSAEVAVGQVQQALGSGVRYLHGGWATLVDQLTAGLVVERAAAVGIDRAGAAGARGVSVHLADGTQRQARCVIVAAGTPQAAATLLDREPFDVGPAVEAACLDLGVTTPASPAVLLGIDQPLYLSNHCPPARLAPAGGFVVHVARYLGPGDALSPDDQRQQLEGHAARAGVDVRAAVASRYLHRMTVVAALPTAQLGGLRGRPRITASGRDDVLLAGDWVGPDGYLADASLASGAAAGALAYERSLARV